MTEPAPITDDEWRSAIAEALAGESHTEDPSKGKTINQLAALANCSRQHLGNIIRQRVREGTWIKDSDWRECDNGWRRLPVYRPANPPQR